MQGGDRAVPVLSPTLGSGHLECSVCQESPPHPPGREMTSPILSPEMILPSGRAGQQSCSPGAGNGAAAPQGCAEGMAEPRLQGNASASL